MRTAQARRLNPVGIVGQNPHVRVCFRFHPKGRVFVANSSRCVDADVVAVTRRGIVYLADARIAPATPVRVEMGDGPAPLMDMAAEVLKASKDDDGQWLHVCRWIHKVPDELLEE